MNAATAASLASAFLTCALPATGSEVATLAQGPGTRKTAHCGSLAAGNAGLCYPPRPRTFGARVSEAPAVARSRLVVATAGAIAAAFLFQVGWGLAVHGGTCDELAAHLPAGILHWKSGKATSGLDNPPLGQLLVAAGPVLTGTANHPLRDDPRALLPARIPSLLLGSLTVFLTAAFAHRLAGMRAALAAAGAAALSPDILAH